MLGFYEVTYDGSFLGGQATVLAENEQEALELVRNHHSTVAFTNPKALPLFINPTMPCVVHNDNGDY